MSSFEANPEELKGYVGKEIDIQMTIVAPEENVDGTRLIDLDIVRLYSCSKAGCVPVNFRDEYPARPGDRILVKRRFVPPGQSGEVFRVRYAATAVDQAGNESALSNVKEVSIRLVDPDATPLPPIIDQ